MSALQDAVKRFQSQQASLAAQNLTHIPGKPPAAKRKPVAKKPPPAGDSFAHDTSPSTQLTSNAFDGACCGFDCPRHIMTSVLQQIFRVLLREGLAKCVISGISLLI